MPELALKDSDLPSPDASLYLHRTFVQAVGLTFGRKKGEKLLKNWAAIVARERDITALLPTRSPGQRASQAKAKNEGDAWLSAVLPHLFTSLPRD